MTYEIVLSHNSALKSLRYEQKRKRQWNYRQFSHVVKNLCKLVKEGKSFLGWGIL